MIRRLGRAVRTRGAAFFALGCLVSAGCGWLEANWLSIANETFRLGVIFDTRPPWLVALMTALRWAPWVVLGGLVVVRLVRGPVVRPVAFAAGVLTPYVVALVLVFAGPVFADRMHRTRFESAAWKANAGERTDWPARLTMVDDLLARRLLDGVGADSVVALLGPRRETIFSREWDYVYWLGPERGLIRIDSEWLGVRLGPNGRVSGVQILRD
ncbi:MAG: hypothetical protein IT355_07970 [Gemmatimonadaceae bacterium]|nr:hypothetical protein [Gemmatimonadaceae bacterium]